MSTFAHILGSSACPDPLKHGLIEAFECEAAARLPTPALCSHLSIACSSTDIHSFSKSVDEHDAFLEIIALVLCHILKATGLLRMTVFCYDSVCVPQLHPICVSPKDINLTYLLRILYWKWSSGHTDILSL